MIEEEEEPSLFAEYAEEPAQTYAEDETDDGLPAPAYRPAAVQPALATAPAPASQPQARTRTEEAADFVAPKGPRMGQPSAETLQRLQAAISKAPGRQPAPQPEEKSRFGINSLINRMTGEGKHHAQPAPQAAPQAPRQQPAFRGQEAARQPEPTPDPEQERIEIPAFLRRQAN